MWLSDHDLKQIDAGVLNVSYFDDGPADGIPVMLLHGFPYDVHSYDEVIPLLTARGFRTITPYLRGYGPTRFLSSDTPRSGQQAALAHDLLALDLVISRQPLAKDVVERPSISERVEVVQASFAHLDAVRLQELAAFRTHLIREKNQRPATINRRVQSLRLFYRFLAQNGHTADNPAEQLRFMRRTPPARASARFDCLHGTR